MPSTMKPTGKPAACRSRDTGDMVDRAERIVLTERDTVRVLELLESPSKPAPALMTVARRRIVRT